jgi:hypothetical protein
MSAQSILAEAAEERGWTPATQLGLVLEYIDNQMDDNGFREYLRYVIEEEEGL